MKRISVLLCSIGIAACTLTGCGETVPELTEEENELITEYAVDVLLKYDKNYNNRLLDLREYEKEKAAQEEIAAMEEAAALKVAQNEAAAAGKNQTQEDETSENTEMIDVSSGGAYAGFVQTVEDFYGIEGFDFQYSGYDIVQEYPETTEDETTAFFAMEATEGTKLLVVKFQAVNQSGEEKELNMLAYKTKVKVDVNGEISHNALTTMLLNDLQTYKGIVPASEAVELVSVIEVPEDVSVSSLSVVLKNDSGSTTIPLQ